MLTINTCDKYSRSIIPILIIVITVFFSVEKAEAVKLFQTHNTWYDKIPVNPKLFEHSSDYIQDILINADHFDAAYGEWSVPIHYAPSGTSNVTVTMRSSTGICGSNATAKGWNVVPIPSGALPAANADNCAGQYRDGHMVVFNDQYVWEFFNAEYCGGTWITSCVRRYDRSGNGINSPYDNKGYCRACSGSALANGTVSKSEIEAGVIDHALSFCYWGEGNTNYTGEYPCGVERGVVSTRQYAMHMGMRIQLNPALDCNSIGLNNFGRIICKALQDYGAILVDNCGKGYNSIYIENRANGDQALGDWSGIWGSISAIPINQMRVVKPVCSDCSICSNCTSPPPPPSPPTPSPAPAPGSPTLVQ